MKKTSCTLLLLLVFLLMMAGSAFAGPYAPAAGQSGSTAIYMTDSGFVGWATGWQNYNVGTDVDAAWQTPDLALGQAVGTSFDIVSLGRGGSITMTFANPIADGAGADFAVFENAFSDTSLELAYVEVSADGSNWYRFTNDSLTAGTVGSFGSIDPTDITGLAGKYRQGYGTPFDLAESGLSEISYVRILDIVGNGSCLDSSGDFIYDPYPTSGSAGFDLDAVGVLNQAAPVPIPGSVVMLLSGLVGIFGVRRRQG